MATQEPAKQQDTSSSVTAPNTNTSENNTNTNTTSNNGSAEKKLKLFEVMLPARSESAPLAFYIAPCQIKAQVSALLKDHGGHVCVDWVPGAITLVDPSLNSGRLPPMGHVWYNVNYVFDSIRVGERQNCSKYKIEPAQMKKKGKDAAAVASGKGGQKKKAGTGSSRIPYTDAEDNLMLQYIANSGLSATGMKVYKQMAKEGITDHTVQSMYSRVTKTVLPKRHGKLPPPTNQGKFKKGGEKAKARAQPLGTPTATNDDTTGATTEQAAAQASLSAAGSKAQPSTTTDTTTTTTAVVTGGEPQKKQQEQARVKSKQPSDSTTTTTTTGVKVEDTREHSTRQQRVRKRIPLGDDNNHNDSIQTNDSDEAMAEGGEEEEGQRQASERVVKSRRTLSRAVGGGAVERRRHLRPADVEAKRKRAFLVLKDKCGEADAVVRHALEAFSYNTRQAHLFLTFRETKYEPWTSEEDTALLGSDMMAIDKVIRSRGRDLTRERLLYLKPQLRHINVGTA